MLRNNDELKGYHKAHQSYFLRSGAILSEIKKLDKGVNILELGCAAGVLLKSLLDNGYQNLDFADIDDYLAYAEIRSLNKLKKVNLNADNLPYPDNSFDVCLAIAILEHLENPFHIKREIVRVLKRNGILILSIPYGFNIFDKLMFLFKGNLSRYNLNNNNITFQTKDVFARCWLSDLSMEKVFVSPGFIKIFGHKVRLPDKEILNKFFGRSVLYVLRKNTL